MHSRKKFFHSNPIASIFFLIGNDRDILIEKRSTKEG